jgi:hypothetical protein
MLILSCNHCSLLWTLNGFCFFFFIFDTVPFNFESCYSWFWSKYVSLQLDKTFKSISVSDLVAVYFQKPSYFCFTGNCWTSQGWFIRVFDFIKTGLEVKDAYLFSRKIIILFQHDTMYKNHGQPTISENIKKNKFWRIVSSWNSRYELKEDELLKLYIFYFETKAIQVGLLWNGSNTGRLSNTYLQLRLNFSYFTWIYLQLGSIWPDWYTGMRI